MLQLKISAYFVTGISFCNFFIFFKLHFRLLHFLSFWACFHGIFPFYFRHFHFQVSFFSLVDFFTSLFSLFFSFQFHLSQALTKPQFPFFPNSHFPLWNWERASTSRFFLVIGSRRRSTHDGVLVYSITKVCCSVLLHLCLSSIVPKFIARWLSSTLVVA